MHVIFINPQGNFDEYDSYLTEHSDFGGQLVYMKEVCMAMSKMGVKVDIIARQIIDPKWPEFSEPLDYYKGYEDNLRIVRIPCGGPKFLRKELLWQHLDEFVKNLIKFYGENLPDFATAHYADGGYCASLLKKYTKKRFTFTSHSLGGQKMDKLRVNLKNFDRLDEKYHFSKRIRAERLSMKNACKIITSTSQERFAQYSHPLYEGAVVIDDDTTFKVIPPGVNTNIFNPKVKDIDLPVFQEIKDKTKGLKSPFIVLSSRLEEKKNHIAVVKSYASSKRLQKLAKLGIFIRGIDNPYLEIDRLSKNEQNILRPMLNIIEENNLKRKVFFFNIKSQNELSSAYRYFAKLGSVFVLTAFYEPFGLAPIEAAACGLAVVATKNGGPSEIFSDGSGILVDPLSITNITDGLIKGITNYNRYSSLGKKRVRSKYTWQKTAEGYLSAIDESLYCTKNLEYEIPPLNAKKRIMKYLKVRY